MMIGLLWSLYYYGQLNWLNTFLFVVAVVAFDMCTTAINNTMDYHKAVDKDYKSQENVLGKHELDFKEMVGIILALLTISILFSLILVWRTDFILLPLGTLCFLIGIFYTFGPMPLSRLPLGELFSGVTMGFAIFFLAVYIQAPADWGVWYQNGTYPAAAGTWSNIGGSHGGVWYDGAVGTFDGIYQGIALQAGTTYTITVGNGGAGATGAGASLGATAPCGILASGGNCDWSA